MAEISSFGNASWVTGQQVDAYPDKTMSQKKWDAYLKGIDQIEEEIRRQVEQEGERNLQIADEQRERQREIWQEQWEKFLSYFRANMERVKEEDESDSNLFVKLDDEERLRQRIKCDEMAEEANPKIRNRDEKLWAPYDYLSEDGGLTITYNGVTFQCNRDEHTISLGDMSHEKDVITIPLSGGGCLRVNKNNIAELGRAITMFSAEDIGRILRALEEYKKLTSIEDEIEEEEADAMEEMTENVSGSEEEESAGTVDNPETGESTGTKENVEMEETIQSQIFTAKREDE